MATEFYELHDSRFFGDKPYGVLKFDTKTGRIERYDTGSRKFKPAPAEADMLFDPDPGESTVKISEAECLALIKSGFAKAKT